MGIFYDAGKVAAARSTGGLPKPNWGKVLLGFGIAAVVFLLALYLESTYAEASKALLHIVEVIVTAVLALLGIEAAKA